MSPYSASPWLGAGKRIYMQEVGTRDGFQIEPTFVPTKDKIDLINLLSRSGLAKIEVTAFVSPAAIPALKDAEIVLREIERQPGVVYTALVPNVRGAERAIDAKADELNLVMSCSETHNIANLRMTREQSFDSLREVIALARQQGVDVNVSLSTVFGCPMEGDIELSTVKSWISRFLHLGVHGITLCDTTGMAYPSQVFETVGLFKTCFPKDGLALHFHNTRGMGLANTLAAISAGADRFDASIGGLGGCPYAPGASGNVCTEEIVLALSLMNYQTNCELVKLLEASGRLPALVGHDVPSQILKAGERLKLHTPPADFAVWRERALRRDTA